MAEELAADPAPESPGGGVDDPKAANARELHQAVREEGEEELERPVSSLFWSGLAGGLAITSSLIAEGILTAKLAPSPTRDLIVAMGYPIGFLMVILGRMQLFTESTVTAMLPLVTTLRVRRYGAHCACGAWSWGRIWLVRRWPPWRSRRSIWAIRRCWAE